MYATTDPETRRDFIEGLLKLAAFLTDHPDVPVPLYGEKLTLHATGTDREMIAQVDQVAAALEIPAGWENEFYQAERVFGPFTFAAVAIPQDWRAEHAARTSYHANIIVDGGEAA